MKLRSNEKNIHLHFNIHDPVSYIPSEFSWVALEIQVSSLDFCNSFLEELRNFFLRLCVTATYTYSIHYIQTFGHHALKYVNSWKNQRSSWTNILMYEA